MKKSILITGSSGFIARSLLKRLDPVEFGNIYCLSRSESGMIRELSGAPNFRFIKGSFLDKSLYSEILGEIDTVVHLGAVTGKARPEEYYEVNSRGTRLLVEECRRRGVENLLYVSSIAVNFSGAKNYHYAKSKLEGEEAVKAGGLNYTIVRPAAVIGRGSPILVSLAKLAGAPVVPIFGDGRPMIQPIYVDDLADCLLTVINEGIFSGETFELGGPGPVSIEEFIRRIHRSIHGREPRIVHIPLWLIIPPLSILERFVLPLLPFTSGQLSSFRFDGRASGNWLLERHLPGMRDVDAMIGLSLPGGRGIKSSDGVVRECEVFSRYLIGQRPSFYVQQKYEEGIRKSGITGRGPVSVFDSVLLRLARLTPYLTRLADSYARFFYTDSLLRKRLILLLAVLESSSPAFRELEPGAPMSRAVFYMGAIQKGLSFLLTLLLSLMIFTPLRLACAAAPKVAEPKDG